MSLPPALYPLVPKHEIKEVRHSTHCLRFNGLTSRVDCGNPVVFNPTTQSISVECWIMFWAKGQHMGLIDKGTALGVAASFAYNLVYALGTGVRFDVSDGVNVSRAIIPDASIPLFRWIHVLGTYDQTDLRSRIYLHGNHIDTAAAALVGNINVVADTLEVGGDTFAGRYSQAYITEARMLNVLPSLQEIRSTARRGYAKPIPGTVLNLRMKEGVSLTAFDTSGLGNDGTLLPALTPPIWTGVAEGELLAEAGV